MDYLRVNRTTGLLIAVIAVLLVGVLVKPTIIDHKTASTKPVAHTEQKSQGDVAACSTSGIDYVLITDRSGSMKDDNKGVLAQQAAKNFIDKISAQPGARVGLVSFEDVGDETTDLNLTTNFSQAKSVVDSYVFTGMTCTRCGINLARTQFQNNGRAGAQKVVVLLTDGMPWHSDDWYDTQEDEKEIVNILNVAQSAWSSIQMQIYAIGLGSAKFENFLPDLVAISDGKSYITTDGSQLNSFYTQILADVTPTGGVAGAVFNDTNTNGQFNGGESKLAGWTVSLNPGGLSTSTDGSGNFSFDKLCDGTYTLQLILKPGWFATGPTAVSVTVKNGSITTNNLFGVLQGYSVSGNIFVDGNKDGFKNNGETNFNGTPTINASKGTITTTNGGTYTINYVPPGNIVNSYLSLPAGYYMTYPLNGPPPAFQTTVGPACNINGALGAACQLGNVMNLNFGISNFYPWIQANCGNVRIDDGVISRIPQTAANPYFITTSTACSSPGIVFSGNSPYSFGSGQASTRNWVVGGSVYPEDYGAMNDPEITTSYDKLFGKFHQSNATSTNLSTICTITNCVLPANLPSGVYVSGSDVTFTTYTVSANKRYIFLIQGNLTFVGPFTVPLGTASTAVFSTKGNITVGQNVGTAANSTVSTLDGIFSTDKSFFVESRGNCSDLRLNIRGAIITNAALNGGTFQNDRDLCSFDSQYPAVSISQRLDMLLNAAPFIGKKSVVSKEVAP